MKILTTILSAALIAGVSTVAMAQGAGSNSNPNKVGRGTDANPTSPGANPELGNSAAPPAERLNNDNGSRMDQSRRGMNESNVSGTREGNSSSNPTMAPSGR